MNIFKFAQQMERDGEAFYREIAEKTTDKGLKTIFLGMAEDEVKHFQLFKELENQTHPEYVSTAILSKAKNLFQEMKEKQELGSFPKDHCAAYQQALDTEIKSEAFYREKAEEVETPEGKEILLKIAQEEKMHARLLENVIEFVTKPDSYLESAEFRQMENF